jgi:hypothetical protein
MNSPKLPSNGNRRAGTERRQFLFAVHIPERRSGMERRNRFDRMHEFLLYRHDLERSKTYH